MSVNKFINGELKMVAGLTPGGDGNIQYITQEEYDALPDDKYENNIEYHITDGGINNATASNVEYDNTTSGLNATTVQSAVDELKEDLNKLGATQATEIITQSVASSSWVKLVDLQLESGSYVIIRKAIATFPSDKPSKLLVSDTSSATGYGYCTAYGSGSVGANVLSVGGSNKLISLWVRHDAGTNIDISGFISVIKVG